MAVGPFTGAAVGARPAPDGPFCLLFAIVSAGWTTDGDTIVILVADGSVR
ncbi:hypothetical protein FsymDg_0610 [Candidatus Protofrankia datiscae]|uniref:Uncharacterized protein n=1 Tax=Candidatus Protofrankia datiscae TaxID=2716812 RepID=F8AUU2_9ACTN|nr:hypothetical protein FsymDg_0610 [Candidatus Protofrankia datiscae]